MVVGGGAAGLDVPAASSTRESALGSLRRVAFLLERAQADEHRSAAFRGAARVVETLPAGELTARVAAQSLTAVPCSAVEINSRPDRLDPPHALLEVVIAAGCVFAIDSDAHAPGQLDWQASGCARAAAHGLSADFVVDAWPVEQLLSWTRKGLT